MDAFTKRFYEKGNEINKKDGVNKQYPIGKKKEVAKKMKKGPRKAPCMNCGARHPEKDIDYEGDEKWSCPSCK